MKNQINKFLTTFLTITFALAITLSSISEASAQRYLTEIRDTSEIKGIGQFADSLGQFLKIAETLEEGGINPTLVRQLEAAGKKVKDGTSSFRSNVKVLIRNFKAKNQWNDALDSQFNELLGSRKVKGFYQSNSGRKILTDVDAAINAFNAQIDEIMVIAVKRRTTNLVGNSALSQNSFAPIGSGGKFKLKCAVLGVAIFGAELLRAPKTAENLDGFFDKGCGAAATTAT